MANSDDNDILDGRVPDPGAEATPSERTHAKAFADLIDKAIAGRTPPAAMSADDRALLEVATVIRAASGNAELAAAKRSSLVESALRLGIGATSVVKVTPISRARAKRFAPWIVAGTSMAVAAAAIVLWLGAPRHVNVIERVPTAMHAVPENWKSRPTDSLIGPIERVHAGDASARIDTIFADRLDGYREIRLRGGHTP
ncbi:MAG TPA: hypothetical protein VF403_12105 [Kofleriaceae bacterium]